MKLNKKNTKIWLKALRSGDYRQGKGYLHTTKSGIDRFCCLGVACDILYDGDWEAPISDYVTNTDSWWSVMSNNSGLPPAVVDMLSISQDRETALMLKNDNVGENFNQIADTIEGWLNDEA